MNCPEHSTRANAHNPNDVEERHRKKNEHLMLLVPCTPERGRLFWYSQQSELKKKKYICNGVRTPAGT